MIATKLTLDDFVVGHTWPGIPAVIRTDTPAEWATMAAPVFETQIDLQNGAPRIGIGPSPRQDFSSLIDRLRIPAEDNYQAG